MSTNWTLDYITINIRKECLYNKPRLSIFFKSTSTSLFAGGTIDTNWINFHEYLIQHSWKSGGTKDHFRQVKVPGTALYWKAYTTCVKSPEYDPLYDCVGS
jgi:hypothetical protein